MTWRIDLSRASDTATVDATIRPDSIIEPDFQLEPTAVSSWAAEVPYSESLEEWVGNHARVYFETDDGDELIIRGPIVSVESDDDNGTTMIRGRDVVEELRRARDDRNGIVFEVDAAAAHNAIERFYEDSRFRYWTTEVYEPDTEMQVSNKIVQQSVDFDAVFTEPADEPVSVSTNRVSVDPVTRFVEAEDIWSGSTTTSAEYSGDGAAILETTDQWVEFSVNTFHDIPEGEVGLAIRADTTDGSAPTVEFSLDGTTIDTFDNWIDTVDWWTVGDGTFTGDGWTRSLDAGEHTIRVEVTNGGATDDEFHLDCLALYDKRYVPDAMTWDNTTDSFNVLDDPPLYPPADFGVTIAADEVSQEWNIVEGELYAEVDGGDYPQRLELKFGTEWVGHDNVEHVAGANSYPTTSIQGRVRLGADRAAGAQNETPKYNHTASDLVYWELTIDGNDLPVISDKTYSGTYLDVWQQLHDDANMVSVAGYQVDGKRLESFRPGEVTQEATWMNLGHNRELDLTDYANRIRAIGARPFEGQDRREITVTNEAEVNDFGGVVEGDPVVVEDESDMDVLRTEARSELADAVLARTMTGEIDVAPIALSPGYSYPVPELSRDPEDPQYLTLWSVSFSDESGTLSFGKPDDLASALATLRSEVRRR